MRSTTISKTRAAAVAVLAAAAFAVGLPGAAGAQETHSSGEIQRAAQTWVNRGAPYDQLTPASQRLVSRSTWQAWSHCGGFDTADLTATVRGYGNDLAVVRWSVPDGLHTEWTAYFRGGRWTFELNGVDVAYVRSHSVAQVMQCA